MDHVYQQINQTLEVEVLSLELTTAEAKDRYVLFRQNSRNKQANKTNNDCDLCVPRVDTDIQYIVNSLQSVGGLGGLGDRLSQIAKTITLVAKKREIRPTEDPKKKSWFS